MSSGSAYYLELFPSIFEGMKIDDVPIIAGGIIPESDRGELESLGVRAIFGPCTPTKEIVECVVRLASERQAESAIF